MAVEADVSELVQLSIDFVGLSESAVPRVRPIIERGALNIKRQMTAEMSESGAFKGTARSISYDTVVLKDGASAEIGPKKSRHGGLANIAYFGTSRGGGGTVPDPLGALVAELPALLGFLYDLVEEV